MASAILRSASVGPLRHRLPRLLSSTTALPRALEGERPLLVRRAGLPAGDARLLSSGAAGRCYARPCKFNGGYKQLDSINLAVKKDALGWRALREQLEAFEQNEVKRAEVYKRQDRVVGYASAAVALALVAAKVHSG